MEKQQKIVSMFNNIASTYDIANRVLSFGVDKNWRKKGAEIAFSIYDRDKVELIVDVACGTGDMMDFWENVARRKDVSISHVVGIDPSTEMVKVGQKKFPQFEFKIASATEMGINRESADIISISYGIRNVVEREKAFEEFYANLKSGGLLVILEFTKDKKNSFATKMRDFYMNTVLPKVGGMISGDKEAYQYLPDSITDFVDSEQMVSELQKVGFEVLENRSFSMGISSLFIARKGETDV
ncbi:methylase involved in ubiquinone/menaquinone biosynthesis [Thiovulum sp. ES]|nr:methylase involved in ubiquinone/menaquinone biosynthesis [Thiovulum sp. ES]